MRFRRTRAMTQQEMAAAMRLADRLAT